MSSLRSKIIASTLLIIFLVISGSYLVIQDIQTGIIEGEFRDKGSLLANNLASGLATPVLVNDPVEIRNLVKNAKESYPEIEYIFVTDSEGIVLAHTFEGGFPNALQNRSKPSNVMKEGVFDTEKGIIHEFDASLFKDIGYVHVGMSENTVRAQIQSASRKLLLLAVSAIVLGWLFAYFIGRRLTEPVLKLTEGANRINKDILDQKIDIRTGDELGELARTFNEMALSLNQKINELIASKEQTETAQKYLETLFDSIDDGIFVVNVNHEIVKTNTSFLKMMGLREEQVMGKTCHELIFGDASYKNEECPVNISLQKTTPVRFLHELDINGNKKIMEINTSPFLDKNNVTNIILVLRDVTQQKLLEEEIIMRNRELTVINEISRNISETLGLDKILYNSFENLLKLANMESGEVYLSDEKSQDFTLKIQKGTENKNKMEPIRCSEVAIVEDIRKNAAANAATGQIDGDVSFVSIPLRSKERVLGIITIHSKKPHKFSIKDRELFSAIGNQIGVAIENITFYNNIKYLKEFNEEILNNVNLAIHVIDKDMTVLAVNDELIKLGRGRIKKEHIINKKLFEAFPFLKEKHLDKEYEYVLKTGDIFLSEEKTEYYDEDIYTSTSKIPIKDRSGSVEKIITVIKDVSDQKRLEEELKDSYEELELTYSKLKELYKMKDNFLSNISHELRTPLTSVMGFTELLLEENLTEEQRHKAEIILRNSKRLSKLIRELLDTNLIESKNLQLDLQAVVINELVVSVVEDMKMMADSKNLPIRVDIPNGLVIQGDGERLTQVFSNILENAIKFTIAGEILIKAEAEDENVHIKISDTGIGIPVDRLEKIFDRFYQEDSSNTRKYGGTGLGLWISKNIVEAHGGKIWAESKNRGSTFHILLPKPVKQ